MTAPRRPFADRLRDERGMALVMALGVSFVLGILGASVILFTASNERHSNRTNASTRAYAMGQAGIDTAASQLAKAVETTVPNSPPPDNFFDTVTTTKTIDNGTVTWDGERFDVGAGFRWRITSTATLPDPSSPGNNVTRVVSADVYLSPKPQTPPNTDSWKYVYSKLSDGDPNTCDQTIYNNPAITSSFYVNGDLCLDNSSNVYGPANPLTDPEVHVIVRGRAYLNHPSTSLGTVARPLSSVNVDLGCKYRSQPLTAPPLPCTAFDRVWPPSTQGATLVTVPSADHTTWFSEASPGPMLGCDAATSPMPATFGGDDGLPNKSMGTVDLAPGYSYSCTTNLGGKLAWNHLTRQLTVQGTIYIDGNVEFSSDGVISYAGSFGAIYMSGSYRQRQTIICAKLNAAGDACDARSKADGGWDAEQDMIVLVAGGTGAPAQVDAGMTFEQSSAWQGALYSAGNMTFENNTWVQGPMIADRQIIQNSMYFQYIPEFVVVPFGAPGTTSYTYQVATVTNYSG